MALHLENLRKQYVGPDGSVVPVVDIERLSIADGEQVALIGSSGSGKTTLLHMIAGIVTPDAGRIVYDLSGVPAGGGGGGGGNGTAASPSSSVLDYRRSAPESAPVDIARLDEARRDVFRGRHVGYIFQTHHLLSSFTALENVLLGMSFTGRKPDPAWARRLLDEVGLSTRADYKPEKLSVGQQQRVAVARALANRPTLVLADEPTGALDPANAQQVLDLIRKLCEEVRAALILVTHDLDIAHQFPRVLTLSDLNRATTLSPTAHPLTPLTTNN
ncbi:MAG TPA: ABC transporter ATP-binding protein [Tepidisphaeraceae bacterium]